jgi:hypothetical protein
MADESSEELRGEVFPGVNQLIRLTVGSGADPDAEPVVRDAPSRVEDVTVAPGPSRRSAGRRILHVAIPHYGGDTEGPRVGTWCEVSWLTPIGVFELSAEFDGRDMVGPAVKAWRLVTSGPTRRVQRRRFVRVPWTAPIQVRFEDQVFSGQCADLGEGGVRCLLPLPMLGEGDEVEAVLSGPDGPLEFPARVLRSEEVTVQDGKKAQLILVFADPEAQGDAVRQLVFAEQLRLRRAGLG